MFLSLDSLFVERIFPIKGSLFKVAVTCQYSFEDKQKRFDDRIKSQHLFAFSKQIPEASSSSTH